MQLVVKCPGGIARGRSGLEPYLTNDPGDDIVPAQSEKGGRMDKLMAALVILVVLQSIGLVVLFFMNGKLTDKVVDADNSQAEAYESFRELESALYRERYSWDWMPLSPRMKNFIEGGPIPGGPSYYWKTRFRSMPRREFQLRAGLRG
jgi:hypothetical protein